MYLDYLKAGVSEENLNLLSLRAELSIIFEYYNTQYLPCNFKNVYVLHCSIGHEVFSKGDKTKLTLRIRSKK